MDDNLKDLLFRRIPASLLFRVTAIGALILLLLIPLGIVSDLVSERRKRNDEVGREIQRHWGGPQVVVGPVLRIPFDLPSPVAGEREGDPEPRAGDTVPERRGAASGAALFLPTRIHVNGVLATELRRREIYESVVHAAQLHVEGELEPDFAKLGLAHVLPRWSEASLTMAMSAPRSLSSPVELDWSGERHRFVPGGDAAGHGFSPLHVPALELQPGKAQPFAFDVEFQGSGRLCLLPQGEQVDVDLQAPWRTPSFVGALLPVRRQIDDGGFTAHWSTSASALNLPTAWVEGKSKAREAMFAARRHSVFGVSLLQPIDGYRKVTRSLKYGVLFIGLTYLAFFLFELLGKRRVHPIQYLLVGLGMCLFYLLLLSLSEHLGFNAAYLAASIATICLVTLYCWSVLRTASGARTMLAVLASLYGYLWVVLQQENFALLTGSVGLFAVLSAVMFLTRNVDWYGELVPAAAADGEEAEEEALETELED